jgi:hypothetical protein
MKFIQKGCSHQERKVDFRARYWRITLLPIQTHNKKQNALYEDFFRFTTRSIRGTNTKTIA